MVYTLLTIMLNVVVFDPTIMYQIAGFLTLVVAVVGTYYKLVNSIELLAKDVESKIGLLKNEMLNNKDNHMKLEAKVALGQDKVEQKINELENKMEQRHMELTNKVDGMPAEIAGIFKALLGK